MAKQKHKTGDEVAYEILRSIRRILRKTSQHSRQLTRQSGLSVTQLLCLKAISDAGDEPELSAAMIAQRVQLSAPTVTRIVDRLELAGYVLRERRSQDRRKICLSVTELGRQRLKQLPTPLQDQFLERLNKLKPDERRELLRSLEKIVEMMEAGDIDASPVLTSEIDVKPPV
ncbi:MAG TPA: MarR family transcriptional regulator [Planctomycetaceae bacterium]|nr:MarR family transcriptional regulator [Planctomycetaceae bacterium]